MLSSDKGFSLIEVLVSLSILSISVIFISNFFIQANEISAGNNRKLVAANLARMTLDRVQQNPESYGIKVPKEKDVFSTSNCHDLPSDECKKLYSTKINETKYEISLYINEDSDKEEEMNLLPVTVTISYLNKETSVEGYVTYDDPISN
jgi:prepilin-type N-terminal cleavage/methylation domain-containing protein